MGKEWLTNRNEDNIPHPSFNVGGVKETNFLKNCSLTKFLQIKDIKSHRFTMYINTYICIWRVKLCSIILCYVQDIVCDQVTQITIYKTEMNLINSLFRSQVTQITISFPKQRASLTTQIVNAGKLGLMLTIVRCAMVNFFVSS